MRQYNNGMRLVTAGDMQIMGDPDLAQLNGALQRLGYGRYNAIVGDDGGGAQQQAMDMAVANRIAQNSLLVQDQPPTRARGVCVGFPRTPIAAGQTLIIQTQPQVVFRTERLVVPSDIAGSLTVNDLRVGKDSQFGNQNGQDARCFTETSIGTNLLCDTCQISQIISISVTNESAAEVIFRASVFGPAVEL